MYIVFVADVMSANISITALEKNTRQQSLGSYKVYLAADAFVMLVLIYEVTVLIYRRKFNRYNLYF